ncbi:peptidoglycan DD-metalloendopeptidase family protein [Salinisphaera sp. Q1T1-3]|uniref:peptidoglycan DD-metalloendopeptidase family protein n=1 Tax=Salinisphaera sp. Q1T1-3 TaxID=2321229 RepID=UPI0013148837|nr:peptidoglycan DD-metalloendopeptidase family protein [Salinisphaera sp. Q1T1-3]
MRRLALAALVILLLGGCSIDRAMRPESYTVQRGDTLSAIAADYGVDWQALARWNRIGPPYRLHVGQTLYLKPFPPIDYGRFANNANAGASARPGPQVARQPTADRQATHGQTRASHPTTTRTPAAASSGISMPSSTPRGPAIDNGSAAASAGPASPASSAPAPAAEKTTAPASSSEPAAAPTPSGSDEQGITAASESTPAGRAAVKAGGPSEDGWQWPASGSLLRGYDPDDRHRGIEIGGQTGTPIYAASSGTVVYNGTGLKGYGRLIIIKHDAHYLSAYGFVEHSRVTQGQTVAAGAQIADMGLGPGNKPMLHFEIRRDGDPVNPEKLLPSH